MNKRDGEYWKKYHKDHREERNKQSQEYKKRNPKIDKACQKRYYEKNKDRILQKQRERRENKKRQYRILEDMVLDNES